MRERRGRNRLLCGLAGWLLLATSGAAAAESAARAPVLLFISGSSTADLPSTVGDARAVAVTNLEAALAADGMAVVPADTLLPLLMAHRVRSAYSLSPAFLADLARDTGATHLLVAVLLVHQQRLQLLARLVHLQSASVVWAGQDETTLARPDLLRGEIDAVAWYEGLVSLCRRCRPAVDFAGPSGGLPLVVLPVRGLGCDPELSLAATHTVLAPIAAAHRWRVIDPGVAAALLEDEGVRIDRLDAAGRRRLARDLGVRWLAAPELMVYGISSYSVGDRSDDEFGAFTVDATVTEYELAIRFLDTTDGIVVANHVSHRDNGTRVGWFGVVDGTSVLEGLGRAARTIWNEIDDNLEDER